MLSAVLFCCVPLLQSGDDEADRIVPNEGKEIECRVLLEDDDKIVYRARGRTQEIAPAEIKEIRSVERTLKEFLTRFESAPAGEIRALSDLALFAESRGLAGEARNTLIRILTLDPENEEAWTKLGGVKKTKGWELKVRGRYLNIDELRERASDWQNALELRTAHFLVQTDASAELALDVALDVERAYLKFYEIFGRPIDLYVFDEVPEVHIFADAKDYPAPPTPGEQAWFSNLANIVYVDASQQRRDRGKIMYEFTACLMFNSFRRTLGKVGQLDPWALEGIKQAFAAGVRPDPGRVRFELEAPFAPWFQVQARDEDPLELEQVLRAGLASFNSGTDAARFSAQSYTLTHFLVFFENGKYRQPFAEFLRDAFLGKGGTSNFIKAIGVEEQVLQQEWTAYVEATAG